MSRVVHIESRSAVLEQNVNRLIEFLSDALPRRGRRDRRGRLLRGPRGDVVYPPFRLREGDYRTLAYHVNQCRMAAGMPAIEIDIKEE